MKGKILKTDDGWVIEYSDFVITGCKKGVLGGYRRTKVTKEIPLHPDDVTLLDKFPQFNFIGDRVRFKQVKLNPLGREVEPLDLTQNQSGCVWYGKLIPEVEDEYQKSTQTTINIKLISDSILDKKEIKVEDIFNDEKREKVKRVILQHKVLQGLSLINPLHLEMTSNGHGEFPDGYKLTEKGIQYIIEQLNKEQDGK
jgi:hypothetical protein